MIFFEQRTIVPGRLIRAAVAVLVLAIAAPAAQAAACAETHYACGPDLCCPL